MKTFITQCAAIKDVKNPMATRCKNKPDSNGYFCKEHWLEHEHKLVPAIRIKGMPDIVKRVVGMVFVNKPKSMSEIVNIDAEKDSGEKELRNYINNREKAHKELVDSLSEMSVKELIALSKDSKVVVKVGMKKKELVEILALKLEDKNDQVE